MSQTLIDIWRTAALTHDRALLIEGWDQAKVARGQVVICTTTPDVSWDLFWLFSGAQAMGFRTILAYLPHRGPSAAPPRWPKENFAHECGFASPQPEMVMDELSLVEAVQLSRPAVLVPAEPHPNTFSVTLMLAEALQRPALLPIDNSREIALLEVSPLVAPSDRLRGYMRLARSSQRHPAVSILLAAVVLERIRQIFAPIPDGDVPPKRPLVASMGIRGLRTRIEEPVYVIGTGGIGAPTALLLANFVQRMVLIDDDVAEPSNRARAPWLVPGLPKVVAVEQFANFMTDRLGLNPRPQIVSRIERVTDGSFLADSRGPVSVIAAVDNWTTRAMLSKLVVERCRRHKPTLLINAGCSPFGASINPIGGERGYTCLHHRHPDLDAMAADEQAVSCARMPAASILYTNWAAAALAVISLLSEPEPIAVEYSCANPSRLHLRRLFSCPCFTDSPTTG